MKARAQLSIIAQLNNRGVTHGKSDLFEKALHEDLISLRRLDVRVYISVVICVGFVLGLCTLTVAVAVGVTVGAI